MTFGVYVHVPFCRARCGYCDFTAYALSELEGATMGEYVGAALEELAMARRTLGGGGMPGGSAADGGKAGVASMDPAPKADTVYFGGGTPTMLHVSDLARLLKGVGEEFGIANGAEVTIEANPDSVTAESLAGLAEAGFTRVSLGMQSAVPAVLATLERTHRPENVALAVEGARAAGLAVSLDLIYGTPGETLENWGATIDVALALDPDHLSAYALVIEPRTRMGAALRRGDIAPVDPDLQAEMYEAADGAFTRAGYEWYEVSNWARGDSHRCRHNLGYWRGGDWWGIGPGAHSHLGARGGRPAIRWWNTKHPRTYGERVSAGESPEEGRETLEVDSMRLEEVLLGVRLREGLDIGILEDGARAALPALVDDGLIGGTGIERGRVVLTLRGRLLADVVVRSLT